MLILVVEPQLTDFYNYSQTGNLIVSADCVNLHNKRNSKTVCCLVLHLVSLELSQNLEETNIFFKFIFTLYNRIREPGYCLLW